ncbi:MAG TPA: aspartyl/asparaginyl beta-hydroxylase domain-containing protein [Oscillatoriales cyanobacterium M59_W2019_021]|nr:MAG: aspartyl/asparaginyl beta-hydroxylase domain-containing protein [Cyanobacteria bacterium J055]HIK31282.1 aspartyl/asparaginyl beta-hydroxylase domain-containing protein [Oscillatoriales cyanobacterium M4454_W2019_049]HIK51860.1 aspartyl/asparaginyl beta-hydroxylase domain-containing protein [Oscillatoriales cyanobacterium M59_W2019_021]
METFYSKFKAKNRKLLLHYGEKFVRQLEKPIAHYSLVGDSTFFDPDKFSWIAEIEANWKSIRQELDEILKYQDNLPNFQDISKDQVSITQDNLWKTYFLYAYGLKAQKNCDRCPETTRLMERIPGMKTAFFSILLPGKHIPEHRGPYKGVLRYHLGLRIPEPREKCGIRVGNDVRHWEEGKSLVFDDSFPHEAWNKTDGVRVILFVDMVRPLPFPWSAVNESLISAIAHSPFVQDANTNQKQWDDRLEQLMNRRLKD